MTNTQHIKDTPYFRYAEDVINGDIVAGELVQLACKRFMADLLRDDLEFRAEIGDKFIEFANVIKHFKGKSTGKQFTLEAWQQFICYNMLCWYWRGTDNRRFTSSLLCISRKSGKTALAALLCLWFLLFDGEGSPEVDLSANSRQQAGVAYEFCENFCRQLDPKGKALKIYRNGIKSNFNLGKLNVFAADSTKLDGFNASFFLVDEMAASRSTAMYDVLRSSQGQRKNPMGMIISTVGFDLSSPFYSMYQVGAEVLHGIKTDDSYFYMIFSLDDNDDWTNENVWEKIAPNLNVTVDKKYLREQVQYAKNNPSAEVGILTKNFNKWCSSSETWIGNDYINRISKDVNISDFNIDTMCYAGIDLAATSDLTCLSLLLTDDDQHLFFKNFYYLPQSALVESPNKEYYKQWQRQGYLTVTEGNVTDYDYILNDLMRINDKVCLQRVSYDQWNSTFFTIKATENGLPMQPFSQSIANMNRPTKSLERLIREGQNITIDNNPINRFCFQNARTKTDWNENIKIVKSSKDSKIDGVVALIMALGGYIDSPRYSGEILVL